MEMGFNYLFTQIRLKWKIEVESFKSPVFPMNSLYGEGLDLI